MRYFHSELTLVINYQNPAFYLQMVIQRGNFKLGIRKNC